MMALTLSRPWAAIVAAGRKRVENRSWAPPRGLVGNDLALHAGKGWDRDGQTWIDEHFGKEAYGDLPFMEHSVIVAVAKLFTFVYKDVDEAAPVSIHVMTPEDRMWFFGDVGWILRDIRRLPRPVPCRGYQRLWALPFGVERDVKAQLDELGRAA